MKKVLIVDDQEDILEVLCFYIEGNFDNVEVIEATNGNEAVAILNSESIDSIICDYRMPGGNGNIVFDYNFPKKKIPFAWHSATFSIDCDNLVDKELYDYKVLTKPVEEEELTGIISSMLKLDDQETSYFKVKTSIVRNFESDQLKIYTKIGKKFILMDQDALSPQRIEQYEIRGLTHFYLEEEDFKKVGNSLIHNLHKKIDACGTLEDVYFVASDIVDSFSAHLLGRGIDFDKIELANSCAQKCLSALNKSSGIKKLMSGVIDKTNYLSSHSLLTIQISSLICNKEEILLKIANVSILHDLCIKNERLAKISPESTEYNMLSASEKEIVAGHGRIVCENIKDHGFDEEVLKLIDSHHFITKSEENDLFLIFSIAHELADYICISGLENLESKISEMSKQSQSKKRDSALFTLSKTLLI